MFLLCLFVRLVILFLCLLLCLFWLFYVGLGVVVLFSCLLVLCIICFVCLLRLFMCLFFCGTCCDSAFVLI